MPKEEQQGILSHCHESACGGHFASLKTTMKVLQSGFYWPSLYKDAHNICCACDKCQRIGKISYCHMMPLNPILVVDLFDVWGIDFIGSFPVPLDTYIYWSELTMCLSGLKQCLARQQTTGWCSNF